MNSFRLLASLAVFLASPVSAYAETTCTASEKLQCLSGSGCQAVEPTIVVRLNPNLGTYSRCDAKGCDDYQAQYSSSGMFINIALPERGLLAKMAVDGSYFTEVATLATAVLVTFGSCKIGPTQ